MLTFLCTARRSENSIVLFIVNHCANFTLKLYYSKKLKKISWLVTNKIGNIFSISMEKNWGQREIKKFGLKVVSFEPHSNLKSIHKCRQNTATNAFRSYVSGHTLLSCFRGKYLKRALPAHNKQKRGKKNILASRQCSVCLKG